MPRIRSTKPEFWTDSKIVRLSPMARLLFMGSWNFADDHGCLAPDALQLKLQVLPADDVDADALVAELFDLGLFEALRSEDGRDFWHIANWSKHQRINRPTPSEFGPPTAWGHAPTRPFSEDSVKTHTPLSEDSRGKGREGKGREGSIAPREDSVSERADVVALPASPRKANPVWDTLTELFGEPTEARRSLHGRVTKYLTDRQATPDEIRRRSTRIVELWGEKALTITALENHWTRFDAEVGQIEPGAVEAWTEEQERERRRAEAAVADLARAKGLPS